MRILVMGSGGIGGYYGARLAQAGADVFFVARGAHLAALQASGLRVTSAAGDFHLPSVKAGADPRAAGPVDVVLHATKYRDLEESARQVQPVLKPEGFVVHFQNGVDVADRLATVLGRKPLVGGAAYGVVEILAPGHIGHSTKLHQLVYGRFAQTEAPGLEEFHQWCTKTPFQSTLVSDIELQLWTKFLFIGAYSGVTSLLRLPIGPILKDADTRALFENCMREILALAKAQRIALPDSLIAERMAFCDALEPSATSSMQRDFAAGRPTELDALNGTVSRWGKQWNVPTPINDLIFTALKLHSNAAHSR